MFNPLTAFTNFKLIAIISVAIIIGSVYVYQRELIDTQSQKILKQSIKISNQKVEKIILENNLSNQHLKSKQAGTLSELNDSIKQIDESNNKYSYDSNNSDIHINTIKDTSKINKLKANNTITIELN